MNQDWRIGLGYDIHALVENRPLRLGGITIEHELGLAGHTDGDVVLHALIDALFGAAGLPDIGEHFPDDEPSHKGADSKELLKSAMTEICNEGWRINNIDVTIIAERPKLSTNKQLIRNSLAHLTGVDPARVSVKAKTHEGFDALGQQRAIACHAGVTLRKEAG